MGWTVLYIAFGIVALWLLGEVLLQYKARLRWRLLAFGGFLGVVLGVLIPSVIVIGLGAVAFAGGQIYVTLSFRRGFEAGWAVSRPGADGTKRRRGKPDVQDPTLEVTDLAAADAGVGDEVTYGQNTDAYSQDEYDRDDVFMPARPVDPTAAESTAVYEPQPLPDDTGSYGIYANSGYAAAGSPNASADQTQDQYAATAQAADQTHGYYQQQYGYDTAGQQQYAAYSDPYIGTQTYGGGSYDASYGGQQQYDQQSYGQDQYGETPAGGVWVPQQRSTDDPYGGELPPEQPYPYQENGQAQGNGFDDQYRF